MIRDSERKRIKIGSQNGLNIFNRLISKRKELKRSPLNKVSEKQKRINKTWNELTTENFKERGEICWWCLKPALRSEIDGHHIIPRRFAVHTKENNFPVHRYQCHLEITDHNIDVRIYPNKYQWELRNEQV